MASQTSSLWRARPGCPEHLRTHLERLVNGFPVAWLDPPASGEVFMNIVEYEKRLKAYSLTEGFDVVKNGGGTKQTSGVTFSCIHHGDATVNRRNLRIESFAIARVRLIQEGRERPLRFVRLTVTSEYELVRRALLAGLRRLLYSLFTH